VVSVTPLHLCPRERTPVHTELEAASARAPSGLSGEEKYFLPLQEFEPRTCSSYPSRYTDDADQAQQQQQQQQQQQ